MSALLRSLRRSAAAWLLPLLTLGPALPAVAQSTVKTERVTATLLAEQDAMVPGQPLQLGLSLSHAPHWHSYWQNPGDSGYPTRIDWQLPPGYRAQDIEWPTPERLPTGPLINYGYEGTVLLPVRIEVPADVPASGEVTLRAAAEWLVCKDVCIPESGQFSLTLPLAAQAGAGPQAAQFVQTRQQLPGEATGWQATLHTGGPAPELWLHLQPPAGAPALTALDVFPLPEELTDPAMQQVHRVDDGYAVRWKRLEDATLPAQLPLLLATTRSLDAADEAGKRAGWLTAQVVDRAYSLPATATALASRSGPEVTAAGSGAALTAATGEGFRGGLLGALLLCFIGGMILNLMPCVFPVLSIKLLSFTQHGGAQTAASRAQLRQHGLYYAIGVLCTFLLLAALLLALKGAGAAIGWGFQLQDPGLIWLLAALFFLIGLNLIGAFELGQWAPSGLLNLRARRPGVDAFFTGVLAVVAASPCTAPLTGAALGFALTQSAGAALAVFLALGAGMALPFVLLALWPAWLRWLPKPGPWMVKLKQALAFPMFITVVWLIWVLAQQAGVDGAALTLLGLVALGFAVWLLGAQRRGVRLAGALVAALALVLPWPSVTSEAVASPSVADAQWQRWDPEQVARLTAEGTPVFVDFTAAWCVTCQANKRLVLSRAEVEQAFAAKGVTLMRADWTRRDAQITAALQAMGRSGVPVYVLHAPGRAPELLPELLTVNIVKDALNSL